MFEIESKSPDEITIITKKGAIKFNIADAVIDAGLAVGKITGPGEFEIGDATIRGVATESDKTIYDVEIGGTRLENDVLITEDGNEVITHSRIIRI